MYTTLRLNQVRKIKRLHITTRILQLSYAHCIIAIGSCSILYIEIDSCTLYIEIESRTLYMAIESRTWYIAIESCIHCM